jgi:hypothetical protein
MSSSPGLLELQLLLVRSTVDRARAAAAENSSIGSMTAMLLADVAVESVAKAACQHVAITIQDGANLAQMIGPLSRAVPSIASAPEVREAERLRRNRNLVQHQGHVPDPQMVALSVADADGFCSLVVREVFGRDFATVSVVALVRHAQLRQLLDTAAASQQAGDARSGVVAALAAFDFLHYTWARAIRLADGYDESHDDYRAATASPFLATVGIDLSMPKVDDNTPYSLLARMTLGLSVDELVRVQTLREEVDRKLRTTKRPRFDAADVAAIVDIVARAAWRLEASHPGLLGLVASRYPSGRPRRSRQRAPRR